MKRFLKIVLGLVCLSFLGVLVFLLFSYLNEPRPENVRISNITSSSLTISWTSEKPTLGFVSFSPEKEDLIVPFWRHFKAKKFFNDHPGLSTIHHVTLKNLNPQTPYFYRLGGGVRLFEFDKAGRPLPNIKTGAVEKEISQPKPAYGKVLKKDGRAEAGGVIVYLESLSTLTNESGNWSLDLSSLAPQDRYEVFVEGGDLGKVDLILFKDQLQPARTIILR